MLDEGAKSEAKLKIRSCCSLMNRKHLQHLQLHYSSLIPQDLPRSEGDRDTNCILWNRSKGHGFPIQDCLFTITISTKEQKIQQPTWSNTPKARGLTASFVCPGLSLLLFLILWVHLLAERYICKMPTRSHQQWSIWRAGLEVTSFKLKKSIEIHWMPCCSTFSLLLFL